MPANGWTTNVQWHAQSRTPQTISLSERQMEYYRQMQRSQLESFYVYESSGYGWREESESGLDEWELENGDIKKMTDLSKKDLKQALSILHKKQPCAGQESKVISLEKEWTSRGYK